MTFFLDTNVLLYAIGQHDERTEIAEQLLQKGGVISVQVLNELASVARKKLRMPWNEVTDSLEAVRALCAPPVPLTLETHAAALHIAARHDLAIYDALIAAAALHAGCEVLYSEDLQHGQVLQGRLTVRNPFRPPAGDTRRAGSKKR